MGGVFGIILIYAFFNTGTQFFPSLEPDNSAVQVRARGNLSVDEKNDLVRQVEERLLMMPEFKSIYTNTDVGSNNAKKSAPPPEDTIGTITLEFADWQQRRKTDAILKEVLERTQDIPGITVQVDEEKAGPPTGKPLHLEFSARIPANRWDCANLY